MIPLNLGSPLGIWIILTLVRKKPRTTQGGTGQWHEEAWEDNDTSYYEYTLCCPAALEMNPA